MVISTDPLNLAMRSAWNINEKEVPTKENSKLSSKNLLARGIYSFVVWEFYYCPPIHAYILKAEHFGTIRANCIPYSYKHST